MTDGNGLRMNGLAPERFIAVFYSGLGASLLLAGLLFGRNYLKICFGIAPIPTNGPPSLSKNETAE